MTNHHQPEVSLRTRAGLSLCYQEGRHHHHVRNVLLRKNAFFWILSKLPPHPLIWTKSKRKHFFLRRASLSIHSYIQWLALGDHLSNTPGPHQLAEPRCRVPLQCCPHCREPVQHHCRQNVTNLVTLAYSLVSGHDCYY